MSSSLGEPEASSLRTENVPSISDKDFSELSEKIEKSVCRRIKDTEAGQREILRMIENLSSKIDSLPNKTPPAVNAKMVESDLTEPGRPSSQREDNYELPQSQGQHVVKGVFPQTEIPPGSSSLPPTNQKYPDHIVDNGRIVAREARNRGNRVPNKIVEPCETCGKKSHTTQECYSGANWANRAQCWKTPKTTSPNNIPIPPQPQGQFVNDNLQEAQPQ